MKKSAILIALSAAMLASCVKNGATKPAEPLFEVTIGASDKGANDNGANGAPAKSADDNGEQTSDISRAEMVNGVYHWSVGDKVGLFVTPAGSTTKLLNNLAMTGNHETTVRSATFKGELTMSEIQQLAPDGKYDYYTYFPYQAGATASIPNMTFSLPSNITVSKNVFPSQYAPMVGTPAKNMHPLTWLEDENQRWGERISFNYHHILSYIELSLECNLMSQPITRVSITNNQGTILAGTLNVDLNTGAYGFATSGSSTQLIVNISGGFDVNDGKIYFPLPPGNYAGQTFTFRFTTASGNVYEKIISGGNFQAGKIHKVTFKIPFKVYFDENITLGGWNLSGKKGSWNYKGWTFGGDGNYYIRDNFIEWYNGASGCVVTPALNLTTASGRSDIPVIVKMEANGRLEPTASNRKFYYKPVAANYNSSSALGGNYVTLDYNTFSWFSGNATLTTSAPAMGFYYDPWGLYSGQLRKIEIIPNY